MPPAATNSAGALSALQAAQASALTPQQATDQANQAAGVDAAQQQVQGLRGAIQQTTSLLNNVAPSVYGRTGNSLVTSAQATNQIGNEEAPIQQDLAKDNTDYSNANQDYENAESKAATAASNTLAGQNSRLSYLQGIYQDLYGQEQDAAKAAEQAREFDASQATTRATSSGSASSGLDLSGLSSLLGGSSSGVGSVTRNAVGGYAVTDASGKPITLGQYAQLNGGGVPQVISMLQSGSASDKAKAADIQAGISSGKYNSSNLPQLYPQIFGG